MAPTTDWNPLLRDEFDKSYWSDLMAFVAEERAHHPVYPPHQQVFAALHLTSYAEVKVVILGQLTWIKTSLFLKAFKQGCFI